jgi:putative transposase
MLLMLVPNLHHSQPNSTILLMPKFITLLLHFIRIAIMLFKPNGTRSLMAENLMLRKQLVKLSRKHQRSPRLSFADRVMLAVLIHFVKSSRLLKSAIIIKPATILKFHKALINKKHRIFFCKITKKTWTKRTI